MKKYGRIVIDVGILLLLVLIGGNAFGQEVLNDYDLCWKPLIYDHRVRGSKCV